MAEDKKQLETLAFADHNNHPYHDTLDDDNYNVNGHYDNSEGVADNPTEITGVEGVEDNKDDNKADFISDFQLASETKQNAQQIQRRFEKKFDQNNYSQRHERYGNLANFTPRRREVNSSVLHL